ncbi:MAG: phenylalanine--tRNA ligase subunit alpha, partial [Flavobacteriales bacterium]|nr:phenylalanine--tRNA ligase subunit alpha [Flavobacteriales bacterium]
MSLKERIEALEAEVAAAAASTAEEVERFRIAMLGRNGSIPALFDVFKGVPSEEKRAFGQRLNQLKQAAQQRLEELKRGTTAEATEGAGLDDPTRPALREPIGGLHPISLVRDRIVDVFARMGYSVSHGPEVEDDHHNFGALNFPPDHPARDMQDTFFVDDAGGNSLRTHTSSVQVRVMESSTPPIRTVSPGRVYRNEAISARAHCMFH